MRTASAFVSDDVWTQLDPSAGALTGPERRRVFRTTAVVLLVMAAGIGGWLNGAVQPRLRVVQAGGMAGPEKLAFNIDVTNHGMRTLHVEGVGRSGPGLSLTAVDPAGSFDIAPGATTQVTLSYDVIDCQAIPRGDWPVPLHVQSLVGSTTSWLHLPNQAPVGDPLVLSDAYVPAQVAYADVACNPQKPLAAETSTDATE